MNRTAAWITIAALWVGGGAGVLAHEGHDGPHDGPTGRTFTVGKNGDVNIREDVKVGADILRKGKYQFEHRVDGDRHLIVLTGIVKKDAVAPIYEIPTMTMKSREAAKRSVFVAKELLDHSLQVGVVHVAGEALEHVPIGVTPVAPVVAATR
jgi:hypothetical protein